MNTQPVPLRRQRGVSLIEALVALAVMAFGMLGVVGMQAALRTGADQSKQRSEAVRLAQEEMERARAFGQITTAPVGEHTYALIATAAAASAFSSTNAAYQGNASFRRSVNVVDHVASAASAPRMKTLTVDVSWRDRDFDSTLGNERSVTLRSIVAEIAPALAGSLGVPTNRSAPQLPGGRNINIPRTNISPGTSPGTTNFSPPGTTGVTWVFNDSTGVIVSCTPACPGSSSTLVSGFIRFATGVRPTAVEAEVPPDTFVPPALSTLGVEVNYRLPPDTTQRTVDSINAPVGCFVSAAGNHLRYFCAVPRAITGVTGNGTWSGKLKLIMPTGTVANDTVLGIPIDPDSTRFRVCRYTPDPSTDTPREGNEAHPLEYTAVNNSLSNQNFLIISAGDSSIAFGCPTDSNTNLVNANTRHHQLP